MKDAKIEPNKSSDKSEIADDSSEGSSEKKDTGRRLLDSIISKDPGRKFNLDRRAGGSERRGDMNHTYMGPVRRNTIDRRLNLRDRRE